MEGDAHRAEVITKPHDSARLALRVTRAVDEMRRFSSFDKNSKQAVSVTSECGH